MNRRQVLIQLRHILRGLRWAGGGAVLDDAIISAGEPAHVLAEQRRALAILSPGRYEEAGDEDPEVKSADFRVTLTIPMEGDQAGEAALIGGSFESMDDSPRRGLLPIEDEVLPAFRLLLGHDGLPFVVTAGSGAEPVELVEGAYALMEEHVLRGIVRLTPTYPPPARLAKSGDTVSWLLPPSRYDLLRVRLTRKSGSTAPTTPSDGTELDMADLATSVSDATVGTWTYAVWGEYDEDGSGTVRQLSALDLEDTRLTVT